MLDNISLFYEIEYRLHIFDIFYVHNRFKDVIRKIPVGNNTFALIKKFMLDFLPGQRILRASFRMYDFLSEVLPFALASIFA